MNDGFGNDRVRIDEDEELAARCASAGVSRCRYLAVSDPDDARPVRFRDGDGAIGRCIVGHDDFVGFAQCGARRLQRSQRRAYQAFLIVGRDDERDQAILAALSVRLVPATGT
jgi:hypothetical protein